MTSIERTRVATVLTLLVVLAAGFLLGMVWGRNLGAAPAADEEASRERRGRIIDGVGLDPTQQAQVDSILVHFRTEMEALNEEFRERFDPLNRAIIQSARDSIKSILTEDQVRLYDSLLVDYDQRRAEERRARRSRE